MPLPLLSPLIATCCIAQRDAGFQESRLAVLGCIEILTRRFGLIASPAFTARMRGVSPRRPRFPIPIRRAFTMPMGGAVVNCGEGVVGRVRPPVRLLRRARPRGLWVAG